MTLHPIQRLYLAEDLVRVRPADEHRRHLASQRSGRIDPNPHQIDAVLFALRRIPEGGCILADEVGLGKTIEAGLVMAQLLAEGAERILLITPKALLGQWRQELLTLFSIAAREYEPDVDLARPGVYLVTRDFAGGEKGRDLLLGLPSFDLCVIDEAHEIFSGIYKRFDRDGLYQSQSDQAKMAGRVRDLLRNTPVLLLTATPIQNTLTELWGLAQFVEPTGTLLGDLSTFRQMFCAGDDRHLAEGQADELQKRVAEICQRTLRRQAQEFMKRPFVGRTARLFEYAMSPDEKALYDDITAYLTEPGICAFRGPHRRLWLIGFHRRMASSMPALAASLQRVAERLEAMREGAARAFDDRAAHRFFEDLEEDDFGLEDDLDTGPSPDPAAIGAELARVRDFIERAQGLDRDAKADALVTAVKTVLDRASGGRGSGKIVVFTESITTQDYLQSVLVESGQLGEEDITLFRGHNDGARARQALERWTEEELALLSKTTRPTRDVAVRLALVHEFKTRSKVFISTEAGAKGLNLQFADTLINYDLPWNPQRIEQRTGRIHRYGQTRDVSIINFAARGNEAQQLTLDILTQKLDLFGTVLGASDEVLHEPSTDAPEALVGVIGPDFEARLRRIYARARSPAEIETELRALRASVDEDRARFEATHARTARLIESRFDEQVKMVFRRIQDSLPRELAAFDRDLEQVVGGYLDALDAPYTRHPVPNGVRLTVEPCERLPGDLQGGFSAHLGDAREHEDGELLHLGHPLVRAAVEEARLAARALSAVIIAAPPTLVDHVGATGRLRIIKLRYSGFESREELTVVAQLEDGDGPLDVEVAQQLVSRAAIRPAPGPLKVDIDDEDMNDAVEEFLFVVGGEAAKREQARFDRAVEQIETFIEDRVLLLERRRLAAEAKVRDAEARRDGAVGAEARTRAEATLRDRTSELEAVEAELGRLRQRDDEAYTRWMKRAHARRSRPPSVELLLDVRFALVGAHE